MIIWINGAFGAGKTTCAYELHRRLPDSCVYDPENVGYFIRNNFPRVLHESNFQDHEEWRTINLTLIRKLYRDYSGTIIIPMTIINPQYYDEIIGKLHDDGTDLKHYILYADKQTILKRLNNRLERGRTWAKSKVDECIYAFDHYITDEKIVTDNRSIDSIVEEIAQKSSLTLAVDSRGRLAKFLDRSLTLLRHVR